MVYTLYMYSCVCVCAYTHVHIAYQMLIITQTAAEETRLDSCNRSQKIKTATCSDFGHFCMFIRNGLLTKKKRNSVSDRGKLGETILIQWECSNVLYHFISYFF